MILISKQISVASIAKTFARPCIKNFINKISHKIHLFSLLPINPLNTECMYPVTFLISTFVLVSFEEFTGL